MKEGKLRMNEEFKYQVIKNLVKNGGSKERASIELNLSLRQINRLIKIFLEKDKNGFIHGNRSRLPINTLNKSLSDKIIQLYKEKYQDWNFNHFKDFLEKNENIKVSYNYLYNLLTIKNGILSPRACKSTKRLYAKKRLEEKKLLKNKTEGEIEIIVSKEVEIEDSHPRQERPKYFGENIEMDGSIHLWFGLVKVCLHLAVDKATGTAVGGFFAPQETLYGYYNVYKQILEKYGIPYRFTTDNRTVFFYQLLNKPKRTDEKDVLTQFGYACKILGTDLVTTSVAEGKPFVERANGTFQGRLVNELKLYGINTIEAANEYLINTFIPDFNMKFGLDINKFESVFEKSPDKNKINCTLAVLTKRLIDRGNSIKFKNEYYQTYENGDLICIRPKSECLVIEAFDKSLFATVDDKIYELRKVEQHALYSEEFDEVIIKNKNKKYIPPMSHPWRIDSFNKQKEKAHTTRIYA